MRDTEMLNYIRAIRNSHKRDYAIRYAIWLTRDEENKIRPEPQPFNLSEMAAQAVRMNLEKLAAEREGN